MNDRWKALVAAGKVRWMPGMAWKDEYDRRIRCSWTVLLTGPAESPGGLSDGDSRVRPDNAIMTVTCRIDFTDPATVGCLLSQAQAVCDDLGAYLSIDWPLDQMADGILTALEAAPC